MIESELEYCAGCDCKVPNSDMSDDTGHWLCLDCTNKYDNQTGYCGLNCCLGGGCDDSC